MNYNPEVDAYLEKKKHVLTPAIKKVRDIILATDDRVEECIKWSSPTFTYKGNIASFFMNARKNVSLMFHTGAKMKNEHGLLSGDGKEGRVARFSSLEDIDAKKEALQALIKEWIAIQDALE
jgi:uncharacterized protein YdeI (YjbR/CyaY-like superfamily)